MKEKAESGGGVGYVRADQIDLKSLDEQLQRHLSRTWTMEKRKSLSDGEDNVNNTRHNQNSFGHRQLVFQRPLLGGGYSNNNNNDIIRSTEVGRSRREWEIDPSKLIVKSVIARGTFGTVHRGIYDGQDVAVKLLDWGEEGHRSDAEIASLRAAFTQEVAVWHKLDHQLFGISLTTPMLPRYTKIHSYISVNS
ncbi:PREDICTED: uncharacterized protein LOC104767300 [Camelina sativa]|uniref:Uncharacterized protein LOC104767300 n=1 Tax=Camelina sativa TaxID=90675 RepID=A0ABM1RCA8_CAMSA|nr:PREDICTED: uncharacterized protein LOC104767300 [Camelina sativa]